MIKPLFQDPQTQTEWDTLKELTDCPLVYVIEGQCREPGCPRNPESVLAPPLGRDACERLAALLAGRMEGLQTGPSEEATRLTRREPRPPQPIIELRPRLRCVL